MARFASQTAAADALGIGQSRLSQWESGDRTPNANDLLLLERVLGVRFGADAPDAQTAYKIGYAVREFEEIQELGENLARKAAAAAARLRDATPLDVVARGTEALAALDARPDVPGADAAARPARRVGHR